MATRDSRGGGVSSTEERRTRMNVRNGDRAIVYDLERNRADIQKEKEAAKNSKIWMQLPQGKNKVTVFMDANSQLTTLERDEDGQRNEMLAKFYLQKLGMMNTLRRRTGYLSTVYVTGTDDSYPSSLHEV
ncbi:MAG: hypothetical protein MMC23_002948 [Stictis urceolatum]|nr:hypothetical protein [Stictis urceolata]